MNGATLAKTWLFALLAALALATPVIASVAPADAARDPLGARIATALAARYPGARIELTRAVNWIGGEAPYSLLSVALLDESPRGELRVLVRGRDADGRPQDVEAMTAFAAWVPARVALRRILPGERISPELFVTQETNVASGAAREFRGVILPDSPEFKELKGLETRQTILEGQLLLSSAVQRIPDVRRGDTVRIRLISGGLVLSTAGIAQEPGFQDGKVRVLTDKSKRELTGTLQAGGVVEVNL